MQNVRKQIFVIMFVQIIHIVLFNNFVNAELSDKR